ncbi:MAG: hypothetical protein Ct9H300mP11_21140 [Chloroflexota bacterium]|nr:MAG: hypothetical protein Ct9H300mP11_21140 [Chloroflexota bacterium]
MTCPPGDQADGNPSTRPNRRKHFSFTVDDLPAFADDHAKRGGDPGRHRHLQEFPLET